MLPALILSVLATCQADRPPEPAATFRVATFNASLNRSKAGELVRDLSTPDNAQARNVAEIVQRVRPDLLLLNEFDHDAAGEGAELFQANYLAKGQNGAEPIAYPHRYTGPVNTGVASGHDLDGDGKVGRVQGSRTYGNDALGFGLFPGQYGLVIYSKFPIDAVNVRSFTPLLWKDMPGALLPTKPDGSSWYTDDALAVFRLSSKAHWDVPIKAGGKTLHLLASHPTPPAFDGPEDRNGRRNHDEIRLWSDFLTGGDRSSYLKPFAPDLTPPTTFIILGDLNADPLDGGSVPGAIGQLLDHPKVNPTAIPRSEGASEATTLQRRANLSHKTPPDADTADFEDRVGNLRVDYILPSRDLVVKSSGVFWPKDSDPLSRLVRMKPEAASSDHRLVYLDVELP